MPLTCVTFLYYWRICCIWSPVLCKYIIQLRARDFAIATCGVRRTNSIRRLINRLCLDMETRKAGWRRCLTGNQCGTPSVAYLVNKQLQHWWRTLKLYHSFMQADGITSTAGFLAACSHVVQLMCVACIIAKSKRNWNHRSTSLAKTNANSVALTAERWNECADRWWNLEFYTDTVFSTKFGE